MAKTEGNLTESEIRFLRNTKKDALADLSEGQLLKLHKRARRARNKAVSQYRRAGAEKVGAKGGRGLAKKVNVRRAVRVELYEKALSRVSHRLGVVAQESADQVKTERLAAAQQRGGGPASAPTGGGKVSSKGKARVDTTRAKSGRKKYEASSIAQGARRQAKKDGR